MGSFRSGGPLMLATASFSDSYAAALVSNVLIGKEQKWDATEIGRG
jgi:hypothetical protein